MGNGSIEKMDNGENEDEEQDERFVHTKGHLSHVEHDGLIGGHVVDEREIGGSVCVVLPS